MIILSSPLWTRSWHLADNTKPCFYSFTQLLLISSWTLQVSQLIRVRYRYLFVWVLTPKCILMFSLRFKLRFHSVEKDKTWQNKYNKYKTNILVNRQVWVRSHRDNSITKTRRYSPCWALLPSPPRFPRFAFSSLSQKHTFPWRDHQAYYKEKINTFREIILKKHKPLSPVSKPGSRRICLGLWVVWLVCIVSWCVHSSSSSS